MRRPAARAAASVSPTDATSGSVKVTCGTCSWSAVATCAPHGASLDGEALRAGGDHIAGRARLVLALVGEQRAVVDVADRVEPVGALHQQRVVDRRARPRAGSRCARARGRWCGACARSRPAPPRRRRVRRRRGRARRSSRCGGPRSTSTPLRTDDAELLERRLDQLGRERLHVLEQRRCARAA